MYLYSTGKRAQMANILTAQVEFFLGASRMAVIEIFEIF